MLGTGYVKLKVLDGKGIPFQLEDGEIVWASERETIPDSRYDVYTIHKGNPVCEEPVGYFLAERFEVLTV